MARTIVARVFHPVARTTECHVRYTVSGKASENVFAWQWPIGPGPSASQLITLAADVFSTFVRKYQLFTHHSVVFTEVYCRNVDVEVAPQATYVDPPGTVGAGGGVAAAPNTALIPVKRTGLTGRSHHGSTQFSGFAGSAVDGNQISATLIPFFVNLGVSILAPRLGGFLVAALASRKLASSIVLQSFDVLSSIVDSTKRRIIDE